MQMERDWADAIVKHDAAAISRIIAEDWSETSWDGQSFRIAQALAGLPLGTTESITMDPITVRVFGDVAIVTAGDTEKSTDKGKDSSGHYVWTDVYMKRNGQWQGSGRLWLPNAASCKLVDHRFFAERVSNLGKGLNPAPRTLSALSPGYKNRWILGRFEQLCVNWKCKRVCTEKTISAPDESECRERARQ